MFHKSMALMRECLLKLERDTIDKNGSFGITNHDVLKKFTNNPNSTFLVSFPRTGSHWLRMIMELYFERPSLTRAFYYPKCSDYLTLHTHDMDLNVYRKSVIYIYRDPIDTIYSQLNYYKEDIDNRDKIESWSDIYGRHLDKWLHKENFTVRKTVIRYDRLKENMANEFAKICAHFCFEFDTDRLKEAAFQVSKENVKEKTTYDNQVMNLSKRYQEERNRFSVEHGDIVWQILLKRREYLKNDFY